MTATVTNILSKQETMTRWYCCRDCHFQFQETTCNTWPPFMVRCEGEGCGKTGFCAAEKRQR